jgi:hypothetical protein
MTAKEWRRRNALALIDRNSTGRHSDYELAVENAKLKHGYPSLHVKVSITKDDLESHPNLVRWMVSSVREECGSCPKRVENELSRWLKVAHHRIVERRTEFERRVPVVGPYENLRRYARLTRLTLHRLIKDLLRGTAWDGIDVYIRVTSDPRVAPSSVVLQRLPDQDGQPRGDVCAIEVTVRPEWWKTIHQRGLSVQTVGGERAVSLHVWWSTSFEDWGTSLLLPPQASNREPRRASITLAKRQPRNRRGT